MLGSKDLLKDMNIYAFWGIILQRALYKRLLAAVEARDRALGKVAELRNKEGLASQHFEELAKAWAKFEAARKSAEEAKSTLSTSRVEAAKEINRLNKSLADEGRKFESCQQ